jgi:outer membrane immunogenic protein
MRTPLVAAIVASALCASVVFAEEPVHSGSPCESCEAPSFDGFYIGGNFGLLSHHAFRNDLDGFLTDNSGWTTMDTSLIGGIQTGYDWRCCSRVFGLVADFSAGDLTARLADNPNAVADGFVQSDLDWFSSIRARAGLTIDDALVYISAGAALAQFETTWQEGAVQFNDTDVRWGWMGSVGTEYQVSRRVSVGAELFYLHFDDEVATFPGGGGATFAVDHNDSAYGARIMVNYWFGR